MCLPARASQCQNGAGIHLCCQELRWLEEHAKLEASLKHRLALPVPLNTIGTLSTRNEQSRPGWYVFPLCMIQHGMTFLLVPKRTQSSMSAYSTICGGQRHMEKDWNIAQLHISIAKASHDAPPMSSKSCSQQLVRSRKTWALRKRWRLRTELHPEAKLKGTL